MKVLRISLISRNSWYALLKYSLFHSVFVLFLFRCQWNLANKTQKNYHTQKHHTLRWVCHAYFGRAAYFAYSDYYYINITNNCPKCHNIYAVCTNICTLDIAFSSHNHHTIAHIGRTRWEMITQAGRSRQMGEIQSGTETIFSIFTVWYKIYREAPYAAKSQGSDQSYGFEGVVQLFKKNPYIYIWESINTNKHFQISTFFSKSYINLLILFDFTSSALSPIAEFSFVFCFSL